MKAIYLILICLCFLSIGAHAQQNLIKGQVSENATGVKMGNVFVKNINNNQAALTDNNGSFEIRGVMGNTLIFSSPGYVSDTLYVADMRFKDVKMIQLGITLRQVNVRGEKFDPRAEYPSVYQKSKVYVLSPTTWFGKEAKDARRLKKYFAHEVKERRVDSAFTRTYVSSIVPLKGNDLDVFMNLYRPTYEFVTSNTGESMAVYINDSYKKYMALPPEKRVVPKLVTGQ
jgi:hypothetical protein